MSTYHLPGKGIPAVLRRAAGFPSPDGSRKAKAVRSFYDVIKLAQVAVKVYQDMLRSEEASPEPPADSPTEVGRLRQRSDKVWLALGLVGRDLVTDADTGAEVPTEEELRQVMLEELQRGILEKLDRIIQTLQRWLNLFALFLSRFFFFEFPNNLRHLCTTMPWSIWPALVVLWGVCWMFYTPEADGRGQDPEVPQQEFPSVSLPSITSGMPTPSAPGGGAPFTDWDDGMDLSASEQLRLDNQNWAMLSPAPNYLSNGHAASGQWSGTPSPAAMFPTFPDPSPISQAPMTLPIQTNEEAAALGFFRNPMASFQPMPTSQPAQEIKSHLAPTTMGMPLTPPSGPAGHGNLTNPGGPVDLMCPVCKNGPYKSRNGLKRHRDRHERRHTCHECSKLFGTNSDLARHTRTQHGPGGALFCTEPGCKRPAKKPFSRKDNFDKHMRDVHKKQDYLAPNPSLPSAEGVVEREDGASEAETKEGEEACGCNAQRENEVLRRENVALRMELEVVKRKREAKKMEFQEKEREFKEEKKKLLAFLEKVLPAGSPQVSLPGSSPTLH